MRILLLSAFLVLGGQRAVVLKPATATGPDNYEITGITVNMPPTIVNVTAMRAAKSGPPRTDVGQWHVTIRYIDNLGMEYTDTHLDLGAEKVAKEIILVISPTPLRERLLQHLIAEGKIPPARITK